MGLAVTFTWLQSVSRWCHDSSRSSLDAHQKRSYPLFPISLSLARSGSVIAMWIFRGTVQSLPHSLFRHNGQTDY